MVHGFSHLLYFPINSRCLSNREKTCVYLIGLLRVFETNIFSYQLKIVLMQVTKSWWEINYLNIKKEFVHRWLFSLATIREWSRRQKPVIRKPRTHLWNEILICMSTAVLLSVKPTRMKLNITDVIWYYHVVRLIFV